MIISYEKINSIIHDYYFSTRREGENLLSFDEIDLNEVCKKIGCSKIELLNELRRHLRFDWMFTIKYEDDIPLSFGIIFLQTYAGYLMQRDEGDRITHRAYNPHLCRLLNVYNNQLQQLYRGDYYYLSTPIQEQIWFGTRDYLKNHDHYIELPASKKSAGRHVQFPFSQILLNLTDLKHLTTWFEQVNLHSTTPIGLEDFIGLIKNKHYKFDSFLTNHAKAVFTKHVDKRHRIYQQIFDYFKSWDGTVYDKDNIEKGRRYSFEEKEQYRLIRTKEKWQVATLNSKKIIDHQSLTRRFFKKLALKFKVKFLIFQEIPFYDEEFELVNRFELNSRHVIMLQRDVAFVEYIKLRKLSNVDKKVCDGLYLFDVFTDKEFTDLGWKNLVRNIPWKLRGGLKLSRNVWLFGAGPIMEIFTDCIIRIDSKKIILRAGELYSLQHYDPDKYIIQTTDYTDISFYIEIGEDCDRTNFQTEGWNLAEWRVEGSDYQLTGLRLKNTLNASSPIRNWINVHVNKKVSVNKKLINKAIVRAKP